MIVFIVLRLADEVQRTFPNVASVDIRSAIRQKLSNSVKILKRKNIPATPAMVDVEDTDPAAD